MTGTIRLESGYAELVKIIMAEVYTAGLAGPIMPVV